MSPSWGLDTAAPEEAEEDLGQPIEELTAALTEDPLQEEVADTLEHTSDAIDITDISDTEGITAPSYVMATTDTGDMAHTWELSQDALSFSEDQASTELTSADPSEEDHTLDVTEDEHHRSSSNEL